MGSRSLGFWVLEFRAAVLFVRALHSFGFVVLGWCRNPEPKIVAPSVARARLRCFRARGFIRFNSRGSIEFHTVIIQFNWPYSVTVAGVRGCFRVLRFGL